ncbi:S-layer homology domain-containing protein [Solibacillus merdavium]|uniref:S-layer homology domain-containing protein n=1 Tax=Solibacillus merdavium TaxID=2762218 RepID=A0ABR8XM65_9BACL|nr:S-layer homology domain-containing protein [Solibacillus merdavium]MBD8033033.1 S-layer homology domain-containing protein [Solibacillus merdavium]
MKSNSKRKILLMAMSMAIATPIIVTSIPLNAQANVEKGEFKDVPKSNPYHGIIKEMTKQGIISGYEDGTFKPTQQISRKHASALINRVVDLSAVKVFSRPNDLRIENPYYDDIKKLMQAGVLESDDKGLIHPDKPLTRGEMAKILSLSFGLYPNEDTKSLNDVSKELEFYVKSLINNGITTGFEDRTFRENESLSRAHFAVFMHRALKTSEAKDWELVTEEEVRAMDGEQLLKYLEPFKYSDGEYVPQGYANAEEFSEKMKPEFNKIAVLVRNSIYTGTRMSREMKQIYQFDLKKRIAQLADSTFGLPMKQTIDIINESFLEGKPISSLDVQGEKRAFVIMFDYKTVTQMQYSDSMYGEKLSPWYVGAYIKTNNLKDLSEIKVPNKKLGATGLTQSLKTQYEKAVKSNELNIEGVAKIVNNRGELFDLVMGISDKIEKSGEEVITLINLAYQTGILLESKGGDPVQYALYFDFLTGELKYAYKGEAMTSVVPDSLKTLLPTQYNSVNEIMLPKGQENVTELTRNLTINHYKIAYDNNLYNDVPVYTIKFLGNTEKGIKRHAEALKKSREEVIELYNKAFTSANVITSNPNDKVKFSLYYNYENGGVFLAYDKK